MQHLLRRSWLLLALLFVLIPTSLYAQDQVFVRAVLFYSPSCPHCHEVIQNGLPPIVEKYGDQLQIVLINTQSRRWKRIICIGSRLGWYPTRPAWRSPDGGGG